MIGLIELELGVPELEYVYLNQTYVKINIIMNLFIGYFFQGKSSILKLKFILPKNAQ